ncbi:TetR/AcrR family transcriptional regulator [Massilia sp. W12]|uniref:TetR/AcrR family transcriptional regulator n=1 Tax=Massilia sp. W12 TaxID=3126507 RepID=UPI0030D2C92C
MKTSKSQQEKTRQKILRAAIDCFTADGYEGATMKDVARAAGVGDATLYKYFPSKEQLLLGYFEDVSQIALKETLETPDFDSFSLQERLQRLLDAIFWQLEQEKPFIEVCRRVFAASPLLLMRDQIPGQAHIKQTVIAFLQQAQDAGEIAECAFKPLIGTLFMDYLLLLVVYWLNDKSDEYADTTQLTELTLEILVLLLASGLINKVTELGSFILRNQLARVLRSGSGLFDVLKLAKRSLGG